MENQLYSEAPWRLFAKAAPHKGKEVVVVSENGSVFEAILPACGNGLEWGLNCENFAADGGDLWCYKDEFMAFMLRAMVREGK